MRSRTGRLALFAATTCLVIGGALTWLAIGSQNAMSDARRCRSNLIELSTAAQIYLSENDDYLPPHDWTPLFMSYPRMHDQDRCPSKTQYRFAMNSLLIGKKLHHRATDVLFFETDDLRPSAIVPWPSPMLIRHENGMHLVRVNGVVELFRVGELP